MRIKEYIINKLNDLVTVFPNMKVSYQIDNCSNSNYIKVLPTEQFNIDIEYQKFETNLIIDFITKFPLDEIVFVSEDSLIDISNPIYEIEGEMFKQDNLFWNTEIWSNDFELDFNLTLNKSVTEIVANYNSLSDIIKSFNNKCVIKPIPVKPTVLKQSEEMSYALAA